MERNGKNKCDLRHLWLLLTAIGDVVRHEFVYRGAGYNLTAVQNPAAEMKSQPKGVIYFLSFVLLLENHQDLSPRGCKHSELGFGRSRA